jgi:hypothetical protein
MKGRFSQRACSRPSVLVVSFWPGGVSKKEEEEEEEEKKRNERKLSPGHGGGRGREAIRSGG